MGIVYLARDTHLDRPVAIKALPDDVASDPERLARFEREAKTLASLHHPNIAGIYGVEMAAGRRYLVLEHIEGETLAARLARGKVPIAEAVEICAQIAAGVEAAHESGIIHRDLKPGNVMITPDDQAKVLDFGLAKGKVAEHSSGVVPGSPTTDSPTLSSPTLPHSPTMVSPATMPGVILGTAAYLSPEQARGKAVDRRTDIWSFGCVLYECLTGKRVFEGETVSDTIAKILERDVDWKPLPIGTPPRIRELLQRCLEKDPRKRLRDIGEARLTLESVRPEARAAKPDVVAGPSKVFTRARDAMRNHGYLFAAGLVLGALLGTRMFGHDGARTGASPTHFSIEIPQGVRYVSFGTALNGRVLVLAGSTPSGKDGHPVSRLYVRRLDGDTFEPLRGTEDAVGFAPSADDRWMLVAVRPQDQSGMRALKAPVDGSSPASAYTMRGVEWTGTPTWLGSGDIVMSQKDGKQFARIPRDGTPPVFRPFVAPGFAGTFDFSVRPLPHDRGALVTGFSQKRSEMSMSAGVVDLRSGHVKILVRDGAMPQYSPAGFLLFARRSTLFAVPFDLGKMEVRGEPVAVYEGLHQAYQIAPGEFEVATDGTLFYAPAEGAVSDRHLVIVDRAGKVSEWSGERKAWELYIAVSRDGNRCASVVANEASLAEVWISDRGRPSSRRLPTSANVSVAVGAWSPDGARIAYGSYSGDSTHDGVYVMNVEGGAPPRRIMSVPPQARNGAIPTSWSPDGTTILSNDGWIAFADGSAGTAPTPLFADNIERAMPYFSPDGRLIAYASEETGATETFVVRWGGRAVAGTPLQVSVGGGGPPKWGRDGKKLYYENSQGKLMSVDIVESPALRASAPTVAWDLDALHVASFARMGHLIDLLPDGRLLAVQQGEGEGAPKRINVVLNFGEELKQKWRAAGGK